MVTRTVLLGLVMLVGGAASPAEIGPAPLPNVAPNLPEIGKQPVHPFVRDASGTIVRTLFSGPGPADMTVTIQEVLVGPRSSEQHAPLPGPSVVWWLEGHGTFTVGAGTPQDITDGYQVVPAGQALTIHNLNAPPISARIYEFAAGK
jgi:quercetin dioxygenase-like cupin family protein